MNKYVVITTINKPTEGIKRFIDSDFNVVIVGDERTPSDYSDLDVVFLDIVTQKNMYPELHDIIPFNHYSRKNLGYLYAASAGAELILDTDDDNIFNMNSLLLSLDTEVKGKLVNSKTKWANVYSLFSESTVWPRGLPLDEIHSNEMTIGKVVNKFCPIQQYLVDNDPDVDAVFRLVFNDKSIVFRQDKDDVILTKGTWSPFNSQATIFFREAFPLLYLPTSVTSRITDIWRSFVAQIVLWKHDYELAFRKPVARQERNPHNLLNDFNEEFSGFIENKHLIELLECNGFDPNVKSASLADTALNYLFVMIKGSLFDKMEEPVARLWHKILRENSLHPGVIERREHNRI